MSWSPLPMAFDDAVAVRAADAEQPSMGEPGERGFSARPRGARPRAESDAALADGTAAPAEPPATKVRKAQKLPNAPKLLHKMKKASHPDHQHLEFSVAEGEDRIWCNACGYSFWNESERAR